MDKVYFATISYGPQPSSFWQPYATMLALLGKYDIEFIGTTNGKSMRADGNRNAVVDVFLKSNADWLMWVDTDNIIPLGGIRRLLNCGKSFVTALYYLKVAPYNPVAYTRLKNGAYHPIENWNRGEIIPVDMAGMGACLTHRSVFEDIKKNCVVLQKGNGGIFAIHKSHVKGTVLKNPQYSVPIINNSLMRERVWEPSFNYGPFPFFEFSYGRSEDVKFYELAAESGHEAWCDTSVECPHINQEWIINGEHYREQVKRLSVPIPVLRNIVDVDVGVDIMEKDNKREEDHNGNEEK